MLKNLDGHIKEIFKKLNIQKTEQVNLQQFQQAVTKEPHLLEVFDVLNKGLTHSIDQDQQTLKHKVLANHLSHISYQIDLLLMDLQGHNLDLKKMKTGEHSYSPSVGENKKKKQNNNNNNSIMNENLPYSAPDYRSTSAKVISTGFSPSFSEYKDPITFNREEEEFFLRDETDSEELKLRDAMKKPFKKRKSAKGATMIEDSPSNKNKRKRQFFEGEGDLKKIKRSLTPNQFSQISEKRDDDEEDPEKGPATDEEKNKENSFPIETFYTNTLKIIQSIKEIKESVKAAQFSLNELFENNTIGKTEENIEIQRERIEEFRLKTENYPNSNISRNKKDEMIYQKMKTITAQKIPRRSIFHKKKTRIEKAPKDAGHMVFLGHHNWNLVLFGSIKSIKSF